MAINLQVGFNCVWRFEERNFSSFSHRILC